MVTRWWNGFALFLIPIFECLVQFSTDSFLLPYSDVEHQQASFSHKKKSVQTREVPLDAPYSLYATVDTSAPSQYLDSVHITDAAGITTSLSSMKQRIDTQTARISALNVLTGTLTVHNANNASAQGYSWYLYGIKQGDPFDSVPVYEITTLPSGGQLDSNSDNFHSAVILLHASAPYYTTVTNLNVSMGEAGVFSSGYFETILETTEYDIFRYNSTSPKTRLYITSPIFTVALSANQANVVFNIEPGKGRNFALNPEETRVVVTSPGFISLGSFVPTFSPQQVSYRFDIPDSDYDNVDYAIAVRTEIGDVVELYIDGLFPFNYSLDAAQIEHTSNAVPKTTSVTVGNMNAKSPNTQFQLEFGLNLAAVTESSSALSTTSSMPTTTTTKIAERQSSLLFAMISLVFLSIR